jgi:hypothetical protein
MGVADMWGGEELGYGEGREGLREEAVRLGLAVNLAQLSPQELTASS